VRIFGLDPERQAREIRAKVGVVLDCDGLYQRISAYHNLDFYGRIWHIPTAERAMIIERVLRKLSLWERRNDPVMQWSKGMRQKLAVARALLHHPPLLMLDEPFSGLDPIASVELREDIRFLAREEKTTVILTTHDLSHVEKICDRVAVIRAGRTIAFGPPDQIVKKSEEVEVQVTGQGMRREQFELLRVAGVIRSFRWLEDSAEVRCARTSIPKMIGELADGGGGVEEVRVLHDTLEDAFLSLVGRNPEGE
jgi:ABC-2 type transport system ATP-binding protein